MKKQIVVVSLLSLLGVSLAISLVHVSNRTKAEAYSTSSLPTTIDLNDCTDAEIRNYYSSLNSLSSSELKGTNLLKNLKPVLSNGQKYYAYDGDAGSNIWKIYEIADRDWDKSPASALTNGTYNASTNKITNYSYSPSSSSANNPYVHSLYVNRDAVNEARAYGNHQQTGYGINREHVWPKSCGFQSEGAGGARGDPMHLMCGNGKANNIHNNYCYGYVGTVSHDCGNDYSYLRGNLLGTSRTLGGGTVFEPQDSDKGDIARAVFYMVARYNNLAGASSGIDVNNPNLTLSDTKNTYTGDSTATNAYSLGILHDLLEWHKADPVDQYEIHRNNLLFRNYTSNRNPFIDFPEWADFIWGEPTGTTSYTDPTGSADPSSNVINGYGSTVEPTSITLNASSKTLGVGATFVASVASVTPSNADKTVNWSTSNNTVASVDAGGVILAKANGSATITAKSALNPSIKATIAITVTTINVTSITVSPSSASIAVGDRIELSYTYLPTNATVPTITWTTSSSAVATVSNGEVTAVAVGTATITATTNNGKTSTCTVTVVNQSSPYLNDLPYKLYLVNNNTKYYFKGSMSGYYGATSSTYSQGVYVYFEQNGNGQNIYFKSGSTKNYISVALNGSYKNFVYNTSVPSSPWFYDTATQEMYFVIDNVSYAIGNYDTRYSNFGASTLSGITMKAQYIESAEVFSTYFLNKIGCDSSGEDAPEFETGYSWSWFSTLYSNIDTVEQTKLHDATANEGGNVIERAMARYDYICHKYGSSTFSNFINRSGANSQRNNYAIINKSGYIVIIGVTIAISSCLCCYLIIRKKKKQK